MLRVPDLPWSFTVQAIAAKIVEAYRLTEKLKCELRHSWLSSGRQESVPEHTWQMCVLACMIAPHLERPVVLERVLKIILVHDLVEAVTGDIPYFESSDRQKDKAAAERRAIEQIRDTLPAPFSDEARALWLEFEDQQSPEAKLAGALDYLEVQMQHNVADFSTWEAAEYELVFTKMFRRCAGDPLLDALCRAVEDEGEAKLRSAGVDVDEIMRRIGR